MCPLLAWRVHTQSLLSAHYVHTLYVYQGTFWTDFLPCRTLLFSQFYCTTSVQKKSALAIFTKIWYCLPSISGLPQFRAKNDSSSRSREFPLPVAGTIEVQHYKIKSKNNPKFPVATDSKFDSSMRVRLPIFEQPVQLIYKKKIIKIFGRDATEKCVIYKTIARRRVFTRMHSYIHLRHQN